MKKLIQIIIIIMLLHGAVIAQYNLGLNIPKLNSNLGILCNTTTFVFNESYTTVMIINEWRDTTKFTLYTPWHTDNYYGTNCTAAEYIATNNCLITIIFIDGKFRIYSSIYLHNNTINEDI